MGEKVKRWYEREREGESYAEGARHEWLGWSGVGSEEVVPAYIFKVRKIIGKGGKEYKWYRRGRVTWRQK